jgi:hypothetical protein
MNLTCPAVHITASAIPGCRRAEHVAGIFGASFSFQIEPRIFTTAESLSHSYRGGCWEMYALSNGGFYMAPETDAFGISVCLCLFSLVSFDRRKPRLARTCAEHFHLLREFAADHSEAAAIFGATD